MEKNYSPEGNLNIPLYQLKNLSQTLHGTIYASDPPGTTPTPFRCPSWQSQTGRVWFCTVHPGDEHVPLSRLDVAELDAVPFEAADMGRSAGKRSSSRRRRPPLSRREVEREDPKK